MGVLQGVKRALVKPTAEAETFNNAKKFLDDYLLPRKQDLQNQYDSLLLNGKGTKVKLDPHGKPVIDPVTGKYVTEIDPAPATVLTAIQRQMGDLDKQIADQNNLVTSLSGKSNDWQLTKPAKFGAVGLGAAAGTAGLIAAHQSIRNNLANANGGNANQPPSSNPPTTPEDTTGTIKQQQQQQQGQEDLRNQELQNSQDQSQRAWDFLNETVKHQQAQSSPEYLDRVRRNSVNSALLLSGPGDAMASRQTSETNYLDAATRYNAESADTVRHLASLDQGEKLFQMENETARMANSLAYASNVKTAEYGALGAIGAAAVSGGAYQYSPVTNSVDFYTPQSGARQVNVQLTRQRNPNLLRGYQ